MKRLARFTTPPLSAGGGPRPGLVLLVPQLYDAEDRADITGGTLLASGAARYSGSTQANRDAIRFARITRAGVPLRVRVQAIVGGDIILETDIQPHRWFGE